MSRARNSGTVGSRSCASELGNDERELGVVVGDAVEERDRFGREQRDLLLLDQHGELRVLGARLDVERALARARPPRRFRAVDVVELDELAHHAAVVLLLRGVGAVDSLGLLRLASARARRASRCRCT